jgi:hypothetical protein
VVGAESGLRYLARHDRFGVKGIRRVGEWESRVKEGRQLVLMINEEYLSEERIKGSW